MVMVVIVMVVAVVAVGGDAKDGEEEGVGEPSAHRDRVVPSATEGNHAV